MFQLPPVPSWNGLHPLVIHFPIALLMVVPLFILVGALRSPSKGRPYLVTAFLLMVLGTGSIFAAVETGEAAAELAPAAVKPVVEQHEELAETVEIVFAALTVIFAALLFTPKLFRRDLSRHRSTALLLVFLILYGAGTLALTNTAHAGARLVHELGVRAPVARK